LKNSVWAKYMGGPHGQKSVWATAHTAHTVPAPMPRNRPSLIGKVRNRYIWLLLFGLTPSLPRQSGSPGTISVKFLANVNSCSCSLYVVVRPSVSRLSVVCRLSSVCNVRAPYSVD